MQEKDSPLWQISIETIGLDGETLPPLVNLNNPPPHIPSERILNFSEHIIKESTLTQAQLQLIFSNLRYIDQEHTEKAFQVLASRLKQLGEKCILVHDGNTKGSRTWVCEKLKEIGQFNILSVEEIATVDPTSRFIVADDLWIFGEQSSNLIEKILEIHPNARVNEAYLAGTNLSHSMYRGLIRKNLETIIQVYNLKTLRDVNFQGNLNRSYILTFFWHKVPDRFLTLLTRSNSIPYSDGRYYWLVDDMYIAPPYELDRFTHRYGWSNLASKIPRNITD